MTNSQFKDEFVRQFTSNEAITPFLRYKHTARAFIEYARSYAFYDLSKEERDQACTIFQDKLYAYELLMQHYDELFSFKAYYMRMIWDDVRNGKRFAAFNKDGQRSIEMLFLPYIEKGIDNKL